MSESRNRIALLGSAVFGFRVCFAAHDPVSESSICRRAVGMSGRIKEDERNERTIRNLLKLPANKRCINCNSLGPQYVCTNFWTFVCTTCSGIHREFTHRVKSVSMAKFTSQEVSALQNGGNERAKSIYFKDWDTQSHSYPNNSNVERLRDFIRHVYADKRFSGERSDVKPPRGEDVYENRTDVSHKGSRSPPYEDTYHHRHNDKPSPGGRSDDSYSKYGDRSPEHDREFRYSSDQGKSPNRPQIVNDWRREDRFSKVSKVDDRRSSDGDSLSEGRSPDYQKDINMSSPPVVRPVRDILGDNFIPLKIGPPTPNGAISTDSTAKRAVSSSSFGSSDGNQLEPKKETLESLIDFDADPEPSAVAASKSQIEETNPVFATNDDNWASFDFSTGAKLPQVEYTSTNNLDSLLLQLTAPAQSGQLLAPGGASNPEVLVSPVNMPPCSDVGFTATPISSVVGFDSMTVPGSGLGMQYPQQTNSLLSGEQNSQSIQQYSNSPPGHLPQYISKTSQEVANGFEKQGIKAETNSSGRSALPEDLFAASYHQPLTAPQGWPTSHPAGMGFTMHYSVPPTTHNFQQPSKSSNPFDFGHESSPAPALSFPSMAPLHGALPTIANPSSGVLYTPSVSDPSPSYVQPSMPSYTSQFPLSYATGMPSGSHLTQQVLQTVPVASNPQEVFGVGDSSFHSFPSANQTVGGDYLPPAAPNSFPGGNPFG